MNAARRTERIQAIRQLAESGLSDREIGSKLGLTADNVGTIRRRNEIPAGAPREIPTDVLQTIQRMTAEGATDREIGLAIGKSPAAVQDTRQRHGIDKRRRDPRKHGSASMYNHGCRCEECSSAQAARAQGVRSALREKFEARSSEVKHGIVGYTMGGCRCEICSEAGRAAGRSTRSKSQARTIPTASNWRKVWTGPELELAARKDLSAEEVAIALGRTTASVTSIRYRLKAEPKLIKLAGLVEGPLPPEPTA